MHGKLQVLVIVIFMALCAWSALAVNSARLAVEDLLVQSTPEKRPSVGDEELRTILGAIQDLHVSSAGPRETVADRVPAGAEDSVNEAELQDLIESLNDGLQRLENGLEALGVAAASMESWSGIDWQEVLSRQDGATPYSSFEQLRIGAPLHEVVRVLGVPKKVFGDADAELTLMYRDPRNPQKELVLKSVGGLLMHKFIE